MNKTNSYSIIVLILCFWYRYLKNIFQRSNFKLCSDIFYSWFKLRWIINWNYIYFYNWTIIANISRSCTRLDLEFNCLIVFSWTQIEIQTIWGCAACTYLYSIGRRSHLIIYNVNNRVRANRTVSVIDFWWIKCINFRCWLATFYWFIIICCFSPFCPCWLASYY